jgi:hypothetical protein
VTGNIKRAIAAIVVLIFSGYLLGPIGIVLAAPVFAALLAKGFLDSLIGGRRVARAAIYADVQGRYYAFKGVSISVTEDAVGYRWLRVKDIRRVLPDFPRDATLNHIEPERTACVVEGSDLSIRSDALLQWLSKAHSDVGIRFKVWVERKVHFPSVAAHRDRG